MEGKSKHSLTMSKTYANPIWIGSSALYWASSLPASSLRTGHAARSVWAGFIRDTLYGEALDGSAERFGFSHQTAFNMRHKVLMALQDLSGQNPAILSGTAELEAVFRGHIAKDTRILVDGLRSYNILETLAECTVVDINHEGRKGMFNLNTVNSLHSYIKETYDHYRGVAAKYINRYNALFSVAFRCADSLKDRLFAALCNIGQDCYWHGVKDIRSYRLVTL